MKKLIRNILKATAVTGCGVLVVVESPVVIISTIGVIIGSSIGGLCSKYI